MKKNKNVKRISALLDFSIGIRGSLPTGHPEYQGFLSTEMKVLKLG
jgi:hypothetical protein